MATQPTRANGQPATGIYLADSVTGVARAFGLLVITCTGDRFSANNRIDNAALGGIQTSA